VKLANVDGRATVVTEHGGIDLATATDGGLGPGVGDVLDRWDEARPRIDAVLAAAPAADPIDEAHLGPPVPAPRQVFGIGLNYRSHAEETGAELPAIPATFTKFPTALTGPFAEVALPSDEVDWEVELVVVIGRRAEHVAEADGWDVVAGLTVGQDLSERTVQYAAGLQFSLGKSYRGFAPTGPWLVTPDEVADRDDLALGCSIDGETVQQGRTSDLVFPVPRLVAELSAVVALLPGDLIFTGTPSGVGAARDPQRFLRPGEVLESWIDGIGAMRTRLVAGRRPSPTMP
jgi:2-keto-4-pentenoate hydratase/2-oxohepta-3-ene-1,7-dioic acid hydratase in catechol pathway